MGWPVAAVFPDNDLSASRYARKPRPKFEQLRQFIAGGGCDIVVYWEASRSSRDLAVFVPLRDLCRDLGVKLAYSGRVLDLSDPTDQFLAVLDAALSEQESARTSVRTKRALAANAAAGRPHGPTIFGYRRTYDPLTGRLLSVDIEASEAAMLREAGQRLLAGESMSSVVQWANGAGHRTLAGVAWRSDNLRRSLLNPSYAGKRVVGKATVEAVWPPVFDEATWYRLSALLRDPARDTARGKRDLSYLLSFIASCGAPGCGGLVKGQKARARYVCPVCAGVTRSVVPVDEWVTDCLLAGNGARLRRALSGGDDGDPRSMEAQAAHEAAVEKRARLDTFYDSAADGSITAAALARIEQRLLAEIRQHERAAGRAVVPAQFRHLAEIDVAAEWPNLPLTTRRGLIRRYLDVTILPWGKGRRVFNPASVRVEWRTLPA